MHKQFKPRDVRFRPRDTHVDDILMSKRGGEHEPKQGKHIKRARSKEQFMNLMRDA